MRSKHSMSFLPSFKILSVLLCSIIIFNMTSCGYFKNDNIEEESKDGYLRCTLTEFEGEHKVKLSRTANGEGALYASASLVTGDIQIYYDMGNVNHTALILSVKEGEEKEVENCYFEGKEITITLKATTPVTGTIVFKCEN